MLPRNKKWKCKIVRRKFRQVTCWKNVCKIKITKLLLEFPDLRYKDLEAKSGWQGTSSAKVELQIMIK